MWIEEQSKAFMEIYRMNMSQAWYTSTLSRAKKPPKLDEFMGWFGAKKERETMSGDEMALAVVAFNNSIGGRDLREGHNG